VKLKKVLNWGSKATLCRVFVEKSRIVQILMNLVDNAIKLTAPSGRVSVSVIPNGTKIVHVRVEDTGIGIAKEDLERIFNKFE